jgi:mannosyltransferase
MPNIYRQTTRTTVALLACAGVPLLLSYFFFINQSLRLDESQSLWQTSRSVGAIITVVAGDVHVPLYHFLLHFWQIFMGGTLASARLLSLLFYCLSIPALYLLGSLLFTRRVGLYAAFLFSISPFMNWYGNEVRMYTLFTFLVIVNQYIFVRIWKSSKDGSQDGTQRQDHLFAWYIITAVLGVFTHYFFFLNLLAQTVFYFLRRSLFPKNALRRFIFAALVVGGLFLPWVWYVFRLGTAGFQDPSLAAPSSVDIFNALAEFLFGFQNDNINTFFLSLWPITVILALLTLRRKRESKPETEYLLLTVLVSFGTAIIVSLSIAPVFVSRYLVFTIPALYLLLASLFTLYQPRFAHAMRWGLAALMVAMLLFEVWSPTTPVKENYEQAVAYLNLHTTPQDTILISVPFTIYPIQYYYRGSSPIQTIPIWNRYEFGPIPDFDGGKLPQQVAQATDGSQNVYLVLSYNQGYEQAIKDYFDSHYQRVFAQQFSKDLNVYVYKLRYDTKTSALSNF